MGLEKEFLETTKEDLLLQSFFDIIKTKIDNNTIRNKEYLYFSHNQIHKMMEQEVKSSIYLGIATNSVKEIIEMDPYYVQNLYNETLNVNSNCNLFKF